MCDIYFQKESRRNGNLGFGGSIPCAQSKGADKFYEEGQHPEEMLLNGDYEKGIAIIDFSIKFFALLFTLQLHVQPKKLSEPVCSDIDMLLQKLIRWREIQRKSKGINYPKISKANKMCQKLYTPYW